MTTVTIQIGNSDDRLSQAGWAQFVADVNQRVNYYAAQIHFFGAPPAWERWQNACWVIGCNPIGSDHLRGALAVLCRRYDQDSIAWTEGVTRFVHPDNPGAPLTAPDVADESHPVE